MYEELDQPAAAARVASLLADIDFVEGHPPRAVERLEPALAALEAAGSEAEVAAVAVVPVHNWKYAPIVRRASEILRAGTIGDLREIVIEASRIRAAPTADSGPNWQ